MTNPRVNLFTEADSGITEIMDGPWKAIQVLHLKPHSSTTLTTDGEEHSVFTIEGTATVSEPDGRSWDFTKGDTVSLPLGGQCTITAGPEGFRYLIISLRVD
jgi:redox-sensitive bicupin YhaK (pirin superfamily)